MQLPLPTFSENVKSNFNLSVKGRQRLFAWVCLTPILAFFVIIWIYPILSAFYTSLHNWGLLTGPGDFVGPQNYSSALNYDMVIIASD